MQAGRAEVRAVIERAAHRRATQRRRTTVFFLDEIHRFNKAQQDALLPAVEEGVITLIGATTENPAFEVNGALLSRLRVYALLALSASEVEAVLRARGRGGGDGERGAGGARVPRRAQRRRRPHGAERARAGRRHGRRAGRGARDARARRGRAAAPGGAVRQTGRPPLRLHLRLDQGHARVGPRRVAVLPGGDARGRRGPPLHRAADGDPRLRGHRQRRSGRAVAWRPPRRWRSTAWACRRPATRSRRRPSTSRWRRSRTPPGVRWRPRSRTCASTARRRCPAWLRPGARPGQQTGGYDSPHERPGHVSPRSSCPRASWASASTSPTRRRRSWPSAWRRFAGRAAPSER